MPKLGGIYITVSAKTNKLARDLKKAKGITKKAAVLMQREIDSISFKQAGVAALAFAATFVFAMKKSIDAASDLEETVGKFDVVFMDHAMQAEQMAQVLVDSYAMSTREAKQYLSSVQDLLVPMGMVSDQAIIMSNEVVKLSADLASFNNLPTATVMADIQSALVGNFETMKKYGVVLNETVIKQEAMNQGLFDGKGMVNANVKAYVAFNLMLKGSAAAIGDQQRTMGSYANQLKQLKANIEDIAAVIGNELLPQATEFISQVNIAIKQNPEMIKQIAEFSKTMLDLAASIGKAVGVAVEFFNVWVKTIQAMGLASTGIITWTEALLNGVEAVNKFNAAQNGLTFKIGPNTPGYAEYLKSLGKGIQTTIKPPSPSIGGGKGGKPDTFLIDSIVAGIKEEERLRAEAFQQEIEFMNMIIAKEKEAEEERLEIVKGFNEQYNEIGKTKFDIERDQVERMTEIYREAGIEENRISQLAADKNLQIAQAEKQAKLSVYQDMAGGIADTFQMIAQAGGKQSLEAFRTYQAFAAIEATIAGEKAVSLALSDTTIPSTIGRFAMAGIAGAKAALQVGLILSAQPPSFDQGGISKPGEIYQTGPIRELHIPMSGKNAVDLGGGQQKQEPPQINIFNVPDASLMDQWAASSRGQNAIFNVMGSQPQKLRAAMRGN